MSIIKRTRGALAGRLVATFLVVAGALTVIGSGAISPAGAATSTSWSTSVLPFFVPDHDTGNEFAADAAGNLYYVHTGTPAALTRYSPATAGSTTIYNGGLLNSGYLGFTVDSMGNSYFSLSSGLYEISSSGVVTALDPSAPAGPITLDGAGNVYIASGNSPTTVYEFSRGVITDLGSIPGTQYVNSIAVAPSGVIYVVDYYYGGSVYSLSNGVSSSFGSGWHRPESVAVDGAGTVFVADELGYSSGTIVQLDSSGNRTNVTPTTFAAGAGDEVFIGGSTLYTDLSGAEADVSPDVMYSTTVVPLSQIGASVRGLFVSGSIYGPGSAPQQMLTAQWLPSAGAVSYTCTLLYGFNTPSTFKVTTPTRSCSFAGLSETSTYGVSVVANFGGGSSSPSSAYSSRAMWLSTGSTVKHSALCQKNNSPSATKWVTNKNPRCPAGWHRTYLI